MNLNDNFKEWCALIWKVLNEFVLVTCFIVFCAVVIFCALILATSDAKAEQYGEKLYLMDNDFAIIITSAPCKIETVKNALPMFAYGRKTAEDKTVEIFGGCYTQKDDNIVIWWEKGTLLSIPSKNFTDFIDI